jgi:RNA-directed DNA polymerase
MLREKFKWRPHENQSINAQHGGGTTRSSDEAPVMGVERRGRIISVMNVRQQKEDLMNKTKPHAISKHVVLRAYEKVKENKGAAGVDRQSIKEFEKNQKDNLYKLWNRMSSGCYFPPPVKRVEIPKKDGGVRVLGIPTVADRVAQMVTKIYLEPMIDPYFHTDSYGYRPNKSAEDALGVTRKRCWKYDWVIDMDIKGFFDNMDHEKVMIALKKHTDIKWIHLYVDRWLKAPMQGKDGRTKERSKGTPQGGVISPLLANLFLHYAFDEWVKRKFPQNPFARYADDIVMHCQSKEEAEYLLEEIRERLKNCGLELHPSKTKIVYCKDDNRKGNGEHEKFDFLGYTFRSRSSRNKKGKLFVNFSPAISQESKGRIREKVKEWKLKAKTSWELRSVAKVIVNPQVRGWIEYYGKFHKSELHDVVDYIEGSIVEWTRKKYSKIRSSERKARWWLRGVKMANPRLFAHWSYSG